MAKLLSSTMMEKKIHCTIADRLTVELPEHHHYIKITKLDIKPMFEGFEIDANKFSVEVVLHDENQKLCGVMEGEFTCQILYHPIGIERLHSSINNFVDAIVKKYSKKEEK